jgi:hypothetical protein
MSEFVLKGAMLFSAWSNSPHRSTRDIDFLGFGEASAERLARVFRTVCSIEVPDDGVRFRPDSVRVEEIREVQEYGGFRINLEGELNGARVPVQVDVGFGDAVTPATQEIEYPTILPLPAPRIRAYPPETVVAEKVQAMVALGMANSRMKDLYDLLVMSRQFPFRGTVLSAAVRATFDRRGTPIPAEVPIVLTEEFAADPMKKTQWRAFLGRIGFAESPIELSNVIEEIRGFVFPCLVSALEERPIAALWPPGGPWEHVPG